MNLWYLFTCIHLALSLSSVDPIPATHSVVCCRQSRRQRKLNAAEDGKIVVPATRNSYSSFNDEIRMVYVFRLHET
jgi:hypothetical protein